MNRRLPPHARRTLRALWGVVERSELDHQQGLPRERARRVVATALADGDKEESISDEEIDYQLDFLQNYGEIYYVDDWVRITTPEEIAPSGSENETERKDRDMDTDTDTEENETG